MQASGRTLSVGELIATLETLDVGDAAPVIAVDDIAAQFSIVEATATPHGLELRIT